jgi:putative addiction module component (TIGR02574 family)
MASMGTDEMQQLLRLSAPERLELAEQLWESVASEAESANLSVEEKKFLDSQLAEYRANPEDTVSWSTVKKSLGL